MSWLTELIEAVVAFFARPKEHKKEDMPQTFNTNPSVTSPNETAIQLLLEEAKRWIGVTEHGGDNKGKEVEMFQKAVDGYKAAGQPWCLAFVQYCVKATDAQMREMLPAWPGTWLDKTEHVMTLWAKTPEAARIHNVPSPGDLFLWQFWTDGYATSSGHVGIVIEVCKNGDVITIEGNTSDSEEVDREGDGVFKKTRRITTESKKMKAKGFLRVWPEWHPIV